MNLLPGLRDLRAPLAAGYLWLAGLWLSLTHASWTHASWLPSKRPPGNGEVARLWDLGGALGKTLVLAAVTFIAYLIGSFLEITPDGRVAEYLAPIVLFDRPDMAHSLSPQVRSDMVKLLEQRHPITSQTNDRSAADKIIEEIMHEMSQLATQLLVKNKELYSKHDKHMAEAAVRINVSIPLTLLLILATWFSGIPIWLRSVLTIIISVFGFMLLRQGFTRRVWAQDVIVQALIFDEIQSSKIPPEKPPEE